MLKSPINIFSLSESENLKNLLKDPEKDFQKLISILKKKISNHTKQISESEEKYRSLITVLTNIGFGIDIVNKDYEILYQNQVIKEKFDDNFGDLCYEKYMGEKNPCKFCQMKDTIKYNEVKRNELKAVNNRIYEIISAPYPNPDGTIDKALEVIIDITERKLVEQRLKESEEKFRLITEQSLMGIFIIQKGKFRYINQGVSEITGYTTEEMLDWTEVDIAKTIHKEDLENIMNHLKRSEEDDLDEKSSSIFRVITKSGKLKWIEEYNKKINYEGEPASLVTLIDITSKIESDRKLKESEIRYRHLFNNFHISVSLFDYNGNLVESNRIIIKKLAEYAKIDFVGKNYIDIIPHFKNGDQLLRLFSERLKTMRKGENLGPVELVLITKNGKKVWLYWESSRIKINKEIFFQVLIQDITERKDAEEKLKESEEKFRNIAEQSLIGIGIVQDNIIKYGNEKFTNIFGYTIDEMLRWSPEEFLKTVHPEDRDFIFAQATKKQEGADDYLRNYIFKGVKKSGELVWIENYTRSITYEGRPAAFVAFIDITERKKTEEELRKTEERFRSLIENTTDAVFCYEFNPPISTDQSIEKQVKLMYDCTLVDCNLVCAKSYGFDRIEDVIGLKLTELFGTAPSSLDKLFREIIEGNYRIIDGLGIEVLPNGGERYLLNNGYGIVENGKLFNIWGTFRDITDKKLAEDKLIESERKYKNLSNELEIILDLIPGMVFCKDKNDIVTRVNKNFANFLNSSKENLIGKTSFDLFPRDQAQKFRKDDLEIIEGKIPALTIEESADFPDGKIWAITNKVPHYNEEGDIIGIIGLSIDITERRNIEQKLMESEQNFRTITEQSLMGICIAQDNKIKYINQVYADIFGYTIEEMMNWNLKDVVNAIYPKDREFILNQLIIKQRGEKDVPEHYQYRGIKKSGEIICVENFSKSVEYKGRPADLVTLIDITERKKAEQKIKESEEKFRKITEESLLAICIIQDDMIKYVNQEMANLYGYTEEEMLNWKQDEMLKTVAPESLETVREQLRKKQTGDPDVIIHYPIQCIKKNGDLFWVDNLSKTMMFEGRQADLVTQIDITERIRAQQELVKLNQLKSELLRRTSHELKTPLVSIKGFSDLLLQMHRDKLDNFVISTLNEIKQGCVRLETLIADILKTAELESGAIKLCKSEEDLSFLVRVCINEIKGLSRLRNHTINLNMPEKLIIHFEKEQIHQVISNILNNAIKYTPPGGLIEIKSEIKNDFIIFSIKDNGIGFTEEEKTRIFKQFGKIERYGQGLDIIAEGSGFGLFISKKIIELHGGDIWVESEGRNKGSTFYISLPLI